MPFSLIVLLSCLPKSIFCTYLINISYLNTIAGSSTDPVLLNLCKTIDERSQFNSEDNTSFGRSQLLKEDLVNAMVDPSNISESFDSCPYYLR